MFRILTVILLATLCEKYVYSASILKLESSRDVVWKLENKNGTIKVPGSVPGGVYSDLMKARVIDDILAGFNDVLTRWVAYDQWTYTGYFNVTKDQLNSAVARLVFQGVDTVSYIELNGIPIGKTENMFVRYAFNVKEQLKEGLNVLKLSFVSPIEAAYNRSAKYFTAPDCVPSVYNGECHVNQLRKMQASFSWDWGPAFPSVGLWKTADITFFNTTILKTVTTHTKKEGQIWLLTIELYLESSQKSRQISVHVEAKIGVEGGQTEEVAKDFHVMTRNDGTAQVEIQMQLSENVIRLWWPNGYGRQPLYDLEVTQNTLGSSEEANIKKMKVGFRTSELVQVDASRKLGNSTAGEGLTFHFEINGYPLFMKGSNWIPSHVLPEYSYSKERIDELLMSAKEAHMSMLRVWGGGLYEHEYFYQRCDELGILIWQDLLFACSMYPADPEFLNTVTQEIEKNVIDLKSHPSIVLWAGNNENEAALVGNWYGTSQAFDKYKDEYIKLYVDTIRPIVETLDDNAYVVSSPSNGLKSEMDGYIAQNPYDPHYGDTHYYNYLADNWDINIYPLTRFASEYGLQSMPSLLTMRQATQNPEDFDILSLYSQHRQHSPGGYMNIEMQINKRLKISADDPKYFEKFVFYSQISQAMAMKTETEFYRQSQANWYTMGALYWQLNDIWQAPSWAGIEYGGKWKMLHYFAKSFFAPVLVSPRLLESGDIDVYLLNDKFVPIIDAKIVVDVYNFSSLTPISTQTFAGYAPALSSKKQSFQIRMWNEKNDDVFLKFSLEANGVKSTPSNFVFPIPLKNVKGLTIPNVQISVSKPLKKGNLRKFVVNIAVDRLVLFFWLEADNVTGRFLENGLILTKPVTKVIYVSKTDITPEDLKSKIKYQFYAH